MSGEPLSDFEEGQWWILELDNMAQSINSTLDQKRAVAVVHNLLSAIQREQRDAQSLASLLKEERERFEFLHSTNCDAEGWEWGVARIHVNQYGEAEYLWGLSDHSDIDAEIQRKKEND